MITVLKNYFYSIKHEKQEKYENIFDSYVFKKFFFLNFKKHKIKKAPFLGKTNNSRRRLIKLVLSVFSRTKALICKEIILKVLE